MRKIARRSVNLMKLLKLFKMMMLWHMITSINGICFVWELYYEKQYFTPEELSPNWLELIVLFCPRSNRKIKVHVFA